MFKTSKKTLVYCIFLILLSMSLMSCSKKTLKGDWSLMYVKVSGQGVAVSIAAREQLRFSFMDNGKIKINPFVSGYQGGFWSETNEYASIDIWIWGNDSSNNQTFDFDFDEKNLTFQFFDSFGTKYEYFLCREPKHFKMPENVMYLDTWEEVLVGY